MYAVVMTGGKQYKVTQGDALRVEKLEVPIGETVELGNVALLVKDDGVVADPAALAAAKVVCSVICQGLSKKIRVYKKKRKKNYTRTYGHRQRYTQLLVKEIIG
jgi:large subunit ribosomal protein L21